MIIPTHAPTPAPAPRARKVVDTLARLVGGLSRLGSHPRFVGGLARLVGGLEIHVR